MYTIKGMVYTKENVFLPGEVTIEDEVIAKVILCQKDTLTSAEQERYLLPGLVDVHFHGAAGYDLCDGTKEALREIAAYENRHGITTVCPATMTLPIPDLEHIVKTAAEWKAEQNTMPGAECKTQAQSLRGIHLEGPFIAKEKKGAQKEEYIIPADGKVLRCLQQKADGLIKIVTIAPETEGAMECVEELKSEFRFSVGHTTADYDIACKAFEAGADHVTHLYNAMKTSTHRKPSVSEAAADCDNVYVELICDGIHVHPSVVRNAFRIYGDDRIVLISDSMRATGMQDGKYTLGGQEVEVKGALATLTDGTIAGSVTNQYECMKKAIDMGIPKESAIKAATVNPAKSIGIDKEVATLEAGKRADILLADKNLNLEKVIIGGKYI